MSDHTDCDRPQRGSAALACWVRGIQSVLRVCQARLKPEQFRRVLAKAHMDDATAQGFLAYDGSPQSLTDRVLRYLGLPTAARYGR